MQCVYTFYWYILPLSLRTLSLPPSFSLSLTYIPPSPSLSPLSLLPSPLSVHSCDCYSFQTQILNSCLLSLYGIVCVHSVTCINSQINPSTQYSTLYLVNYSYMYQMYIYKSQQRILCHGKKRN